MGANFDIELNKSDGNLLIDLKGDFDGNTAWELVNRIALEYDGSGMIFINTEKVEDVVPFGGALLENLICSSTFPRNKMVFEGAKRLMIDPAFA